MYHLSRIPRVSVHDSDPNGTNFNTCFGIVLNDCKLAVKLCIIAHVTECEIWISRFCLVGKSCCFRHKQRVSNTQEVLFRPDELQAQALTYLPFRNSLSRQNTSTSGCQEAHEAAKSDSENMHLCFKLKSKVEVPLVITSRRR